MSKALEILILIAISFSLFRQHVNNIISNRNTILDLVSSNEVIMIIRNHLDANNTKLIVQNFGNNLKPEVGNGNEPKVLDNNNTLNLRNEKIILKFIQGVSSYEHKLLKCSTKISRYNIHQL